MRFIPTSAATVDSLKKQAKKLQRKAGGKHVDLLDRVARGAGYNHWHHVTLCLEQSEASGAFDTLSAACQDVIKSALEGSTKVTSIGQEILPSPLILFACEGDAWLLEPDEELAMCLVFHREIQPYVLQDEPTRIKVGWDGTYELAGNFFKVETDHPLIGTRAIGGFPLDEIREIRGRVQSFDQKFSEVILQTDAIDLTPAIISELLRGGWQGMGLHEAASLGARYSPSRHSLLLPPVTDEDL